MLGIEVVREIDIRLVAGIYCKLSLNSPSPTVDDRDEVLERQRHGDRVSQRRSLQAHDVRGAVDLDARSAEEIGAEHGVVTVAAQIAEHDVVRFRVGGVADTQRTGAHDLRRVSAQSAHLIRPDDRRAEPARELGAHGEAGVAGVDQAANGDPADAAVDDRRHRLGIGGDRIGERR